MSILIVIPILALAAALLIYGVGLLPLSAPMNGLAKIVIMLIAVLFILPRSGLI